MITVTSEHDGITLYDISDGDARGQGVGLILPGAGNEILQLRCARGVMFCSAFSPEGLARCHFPAAIFAAPKFEDMMERTPRFLSDEALALGATMEMTGRELLHVFAGTK